MRHERTSHVCYVDKARRGSDALVDRKLVGVVLVGR